MADLHASPAIFTFSALAAPQLSFPEPLDPLLSPPSSSLKRARPSDPETAFEAELPRKKRRLRLQLITSRLSAPFAMPASFVLPRVYVLPWIRQRCNGRHVLRKAAILNKIRRDAMMATIASREQQERILEQRRRERYASATATKSATVRVQGFQVHANGGSTTESGLWPLHLSRGIRRQRRRRKR
ncbi:hypothetical protein FPQ18DRAFT_21655 [Pyronema domesticum]|nr:hypothetical protein FPQ18DRAFT_21655 [Pyronema domesticum]